MMVTAMLGCYKYKSIKITIYQVSISINFSRQTQCHAICTIPNCITAKIIKAYRSQDSGETHHFVFNNYVSQFTQMKVSLLNSCRKSTNFLKVQKTNT